MSLSVDLDAALVPGAGPQTATATRDTGDLSAEVTATDADRIGVVVERVRVHGGGGSVEARAEAVAAHVRPGGQALVPIEVDARLGGATLRSPPDDQRRFYEAEVTPEHIELTRRQVAPATGDRIDAPFPLTRDQLGELLDQLDHALPPPADAT